MFIRPQDRFDSQQISAWEHLTISTKNIFHEDGKHSNCSLRYISLKLIHFRTTSIEYGCTTIEYGCT